MYTPYRLLTLAMVATGAMVTECGLAQAQSAVGATDASRETQVRDRYEQVLATDPMRDPAFDRTYDAYLVLEGVDAWVAKLQQPAATPEAERARLVLLGRIESRRFRSREAVAHFEQARALGMTGAGFQVALGNEYYRIGRDAEAIGELAQAAEGLTDPARRADVCRVLGSLLLRGGRRDDAIATWERIVAVDAPDPLALAELAEIYEDNRMWTEAIGAYRRTLAASAADPYRACRALRAIGRCQEQIDQPQEAVATYEQALSLAAPGSWLYDDLRQRLVAVYEGMGDLEGLSRYLLARLETAPADLDMRELLADTYRRMGRLDDSEAASREVLARDPKRPAAYERLIVLYEAQRRTADAVAVYEQLIAAFPTDSDYVRRLGEAHLRAGSAEAAKAAWRRVTEPEPTADSLALLASWLERYEFPDEAIAAYEQAQAMRPSREWQLRLAGLKLARGATEEARVLWQSAVSEQSSAEEVAEIAAILSANDLAPDATAMWRRAVALEPESEEYRLSLARSLAVGKAYEEATTLFDALAREAQNELYRSRAERGLIDAYVDMGVIDEKRREWEAAAAASPQDVDLQMRLGRLYERSGDAYRVVAIVESCVQQRPDDPLLLRELAQRYRRVRRLNDSISAYTKLIELDRTRSLAYLEELLQVYQEAGDLESAVVTAQRIVEQNPTNPEARALLAQAYQQSGEKEAALEEYRTAVRLDAEEPAYLRAYAATLQELGRWGEAGDAARRMMEAATARETRLEALSMLTQLYQRQGLLDELLREFEVRVRATPADFAVYEELAAIYRDAGQATRALDVMAGALESVDNRQEALRTLIRESFDVLAYEKVVSFYDQLSAIGGSLTPSEYERLGRVYAQMGDPERAYATWRRIVEEDPENPTAYEALARILASEGRIDEALAEQGRALELDLYNHAMRYQYALMLSGVGQVDQAMAQLEMILELGPSPDEAAAATVTQGVQAPAPNIPPYLLYGGFGAPYMSGPNVFRGGARYEEIRGAVIGTLVQMAQAAGSVEDIVAEFREKAEKESAGIQAQLDLMQVYEQTQQTQQAADLAEALAERLPEDTNFAWRAVSLLFQAQKMDAALALAQRTMERNPDSGLQFGRTLLSWYEQSNRPDEAKALLAELMAKHPDDLGLVQMAVYARGREGDVAGVAAVAEPFIASHPDQAVAVRQAVANALREKAPDASMDAFEELLFGDAQSATVHAGTRAPIQGFYVAGSQGGGSMRRSLGYLLMNMPSVGVAVRLSAEQLRACEELVGESASAERRTAVLTRIDAEAAKVNQAQTTEAHDRATAFLVLRAAIHIADDEFEQARALLAPFLPGERLETASANLELFLLELEGRFDAMAELYADLRTQFPGYEQALLTAEAAAWRMAGNTDRAADATTASLAGVSAPGPFLEAVGTLMGYERSADARRLLEQYLSETNRNADALVLLAGLYDGEGDTRRALELVREAYLNQVQRGAVATVGAGGRRAGFGTGFLSAPYYSGFQTSMWGGGRSMAVFPGMYAGGYPTGYPGGTLQQPSQILQRWHQYSRKLNESAGMVAEFEERLRQQPNSIQAHLELAQVYALDQQQDKVVSVYQALIERQPAFHAARLALAELYQQRNKIAEAIEIYEYLVQAQPMGRRLYRLPLRELYRRKGDQDRVAEMDREAAQAATTPQELLALAQEFRSVGNLVQAEAMYRRLLLVDPSQRHIYRELAQVLRQQGKLEDALQSLHEYMASIQASQAYVDTSAVNEVVSLMRQLGRTADLKAEQEQRLAQDPGDAAAKYFLACLARDAQDLDAALALLKELNTTGQYGNDIVNIMELRGDYAGLYAYLAADAERSPQNVDYRRLARYAVATGDRDAAVRWVEETYRRQGGARPNQSNVLNDLVNFGLFEQAEAYYLAHRKTVSRDPNELGNYDGNAVRAWADYGRFDDAIRAVLSSGEFGPVDKLVGELCQRGGSDSRKYAGMLEHLGRLFPDRPEVLEGMYRLAQNRSDDPEAITLLEKLLAVHPDKDEYVSQYANLLSRYNRERDLIAWYTARAEANWTVGTVTQLAGALKDRGYVRSYEALRARAVASASEEERDRFAQIFRDLEAPRPLPQSPFSGLPMPPPAPDGTAPAVTNLGKYFRWAIRSNPSTATLDQFLRQLVDTGQDAQAYELLKEFRAEPFMADWRPTDDRLLRLLVRFGDDSDKQAVYQHLYDQMTASQQPAGMMAPGINFGFSYVVRQYLQPEAFEGFGEFLETRLADMPEPDTGTCMQFAQLFSEIEANERALELTDRAIALRPEDPQLLSYRATCLGKLKRFDEQIAVLEALRARGSVYEQAQLVMGIARAMLAAGRPEDADRVVNEVLATNRSPEMGSTAGRYFLDERQDPASAVPLLEAAMVDPERTADTAPLLARCYALTGRTADAVAVVERHADRIRYAQEIPRALVEHGDVEGAEWVYLLTMNDNNPNQEDFQRVVQGWLERGDLARAANLVRTAMERLRGRYNRGRLPDLFAEELVKQGLAQTWLSAQTSPEAVTVLTAGRVVSRLRQRAASAKPLLDLVRAHVETLAQDPETAMATAEAVQGFDPDLSLAITRAVLAQQNVDQSAFSNALSLAENLKTAGVAGLALTAIDRVPSTILSRPGVVALVAEYGTAEEIARLRERCAEFRPQASQQSLLEGHLLFSGGSCDAGLDVVERVCADPSLTRLEVQQAAELLAAEGRVDAAIRAYERLVEMLKTDNVVTGYMDLRNARMALMQVLWRKGDIERIRTLLDEAAPSDAGYTDDGLVLSTARLLAELGQGDDAIRLVEARFTGMGDAFTLMNAGSMGFLRYLGRADLSQALAQRVLDKTAVPAMLLNSPWIFRAAGTGELELEVYRRFGTTSHMAFAPMAQMYGQRFIEAGLPEDAIALYRELQRTADPTTLGQWGMGGPMDQLAAAYAAAGKLEDLRVETEARIAKRPSDYEAQLVRADLLTRERRIEEGVEAAVRAIEAGAPMTSARNVLRAARFLADPRPVLQRLEATGRMHELGEQFVDADALARLWVAAGEPDKAVETLKFACLKTNAWGAHQVFALLAAYDRWEEAAAWYAEARGALVVQGGSTDDLDRSVLRAIDDGRLRREVFEPVLLAEATVAASAAERLVCEEYQGDLEGALSWLRPLLERSPEAPSLHRAAAQAYRNNQDRLSAVAHYQRLVELNAATQEDIRTHATLLLEMGMEQQAMALLRARLGDKPRQEDIEFLAGRLADARRAGEVLELLQADWAHLPPSQRLRLRLTLLDLTRPMAGPDEALAAYREVYDAGGDVHFASRYLGHLFWAGHLDEALALLDDGRFQVSLREMQPSLAGQVYARAGRTEDAATIVLAGLASAPTAPFGVAGYYGPAPYGLPGYGAGYPFGAGPYVPWGMAGTGAMSYPEMAAVLEPFGVWSRRLAGRADEVVQGPSERFRLVATLAQTAGEPRALLQAADAALVERPNWPGVMSARANALAEIGRHAEAAEAMRGLIGMQGIDLDPANAISVARSLFAAGRADEAQAELTALQAWAHDGATRAWIGRLLLEHGDPAGAEAEFRYALEREPGLTDAIAGLAVVCLSDGRLEDGQALWRRLPRDGALSRESVAAEVRERGHADVALPLFGELLERRPGSTSLAQQVMATAEAAGAPGLAIDACAGAATRLPAPARDDLLAQLGQWCARTGLVEALLAEASAATEPSALVGALSEALRAVVADPSQASQAGAWADAAEGLQAETAAAMLALGDTSLRLDRVDAAVAWYRRALQHPDLTVAQRRAAGVGLLRAGEPQRALQAFEGLLVYQPNLFARDAEALEALAEAGDTATTSARLEGCRPFLANDMQARYLRAQVDWLADRREAALAALEPLVEDRGLTPEQLATMAGCFDEAGRPELALRVHGQLSAGGYGNDFAAPSLGRMLVAAAQQGDIRRAAALYARLAPLNARRAADVAGAFLATVEAEELPMLRDALAQVIREEPGNNRVSECAALYAHAARLHGQDVSAAAFAQELGASALEVSDAAYWDGVAREWRVVAADRGVAASAMEAMRARLTSDAAAVVTAEQVITLTPLPEEYTAMAATGPSFAALTTIHADAAGRRTLRVLAPGPVAVMVNGGPTAMPGTRAVTGFDAFTVDVDLNVGANELILVVQPLQAIPYFAAGLDPELSASGG